LEAVVGCALFVLVDIRLESHIDFGWAKAPYSPTKDVLPEVAGGGEEGCAP